MSNNAATSLPTGTYNYDQVVNFAMTHFSNVFTAIPEWTEVPWEPVDTSRVGFSEHSLFHGHLTIDGSHHKVSAYMTLAGDVQLFRHGMGLSYKDNGNLELASLWQFLSTTALRPELLDLKALCGYYFLAAGHVDFVHVNEGWLKRFEMACKAIGDAARAEDGMDAEGVSGVVQKLLDDAKERRLEWARRMEDELVVAWPDYKMAWK
ncbi:hypothetical protein T440DRAFT_464115 [Plenodomus tracheiphilus IPT5]|uniref:Uncharacterized protein n=1 Tax=Plenodomus tracheiphilus IPT5 TaxID=1408161 RepID=A0A6A7BJP9_9PLEO|nr:hypothetical protein T440DRAFT_464115 [Plenodomus tracheiphilus IPT5]